MLSPEEHEMYLRHLSLPEIGEQGQLRLKNSRVLVIGAGGLGCPVLQYLNAAGVGSLGIMDFDVVEKSNLQRQILFDYRSLGKNKASEAKKRLEQANPYTTIEVYPEKITSTNALDRISAYDFVVDCTDNFESRYLINDACVLTNKTWVYGAIHQFEGQVSVFNYRSGATYRCLFPQSDKNTALKNCSDIGVLGVLPGIVGTLQANEVLKLILGQGEILDGCLLCFDALKLDFQSFTFQALPTTFYVNLRERNTLIEADYALENCTLTGVSIPEITWAELNEDYTYVDVRDANEVPPFTAYRVKQIPLSELEIQWDSLDKNKTIVCLCQSGQRSLQAAQLLLEKNAFKTVYSLQGGMNKRPIKEFN